MLFVKIITFYSFSCTKSLHGETITIAAFGSGNAIQWREYNPETMATSSF
jgi:hypothetical protein